MVVAYDRIFSSVFIEDIFYLHFIPRFFYHVLLLGDAIDELPHLLQNIQRWITSCIARISPRIDPHTILKIAASTLNAIEIVPRHLTLCLEKAMNMVSKRSC
jgi:hypothetical protein